MRARAFMLLAADYRRTAVFRLPDDPDVRRRTERISLPTELDDVEVVGGEAVEGGVQHAVVPSRIHGPADVHVRPAVVGHDEAVTLHRAKDALDLNTKV